MSTTEDNNLLQPVRTSYTEQRSRRLSELEQLRKHQSVKALRETHTKDGTPTATTLSMEEWQKQQRALTAEDKKKKRDSANLLHSYNYSDLISPTADELLLSESNALSSVERYRLQQKIMVEDRKKSMNDAKKNLHSFRMDPEVIMKQTKRNSGAMSFSPSQQQHLQPDVIAPDPRLRLSSAMELFDRTNAIVEEDYNDARKKWQSGGGLAYIGDDNIGVDGDGPDGDLEDDEMKSTTSTDDNNILNGDQGGTIVNDGVHLWEQVDDKNNDQREQKQNPWEIPDDNADIMPSAVVVAKKEEEEETLIHDDNINQAVATDISNYDNEDNEDNTCEQNISTTKDDTDIAAVESIKDDSNEDNDNEPDLENNDEPSPMTESDINDVSERTEAAAHDMVNDDGHDDPAKDDQDEQHPWEIPDDNADTMPSAVAVAKKEEEEEETSIHDDNINQAMMTEINNYDNDDNEDSSCVENISTTKDDTDIAAVESLIQSLSINDGSNDDDDNDNEPDLENNDEPSPMIESDINDMQEQEYLPQSHSGNNTDEMISNPSVITKTNKPYMDDDIGNDNGCTENHNEVTTTEITTPKDEQQEMVIPATATTAMVLEAKIDDTTATAATTVETESSKDCSNQQPPNNENEPSSVTAQEETETNEHDLPPPPETNGDDNVATHIKKETEEDKEHQYDNGTVDSTPPCHDTDQNLDTADRSSPSPPVSATTLNDTDDVDDDDTLNVQFSFGLVTRRRIVVRDDCPVHIKKIMISTAEKVGKTILEKEYPDVAFFRDDRPPTLINIENDESYQPPSSRPNTLRYMVRANLCVTLKDQSLAKEVKKKILKALRASVGSGK